MAAPCVGALDLARIPGARARLEIPRSYRGQDVGERDGTRKPYAFNT